MKIIKIKLILFITIIMLVFTGCSNKSTSTNNNSENNSITNTIVLPDFIEKNILTDTDIINEIKLEEIRDNLNLKKYNISDLTSESDLQLYETTIDKQTSKTLVKHIKDKHDINVTPDRKSVV